MLLFPSLQRLPPHDRVRQRHADLQECLTQVRTARPRSQGRLGLLSLVMEELTELGWAWTGTRQTCRGAVRTDFLWASPLGPTWCAKLCA